MASSWKILLGLAREDPLVPPPYFTSRYLIFLYLWAFAITSSRAWKIHYGLDHQVSPREDLTKYGAAAVSKGKITQKQLDQIRRIDSAHANAVEHFPVIASAVALAHIAKLQPEVINSALLTYTVARVAYFISYAYTTSHRLSYLRAVAWWTSGITCLRLFYKAGQALNA